MSDNRVSACIARFLQARATPGNADLVKFWCDNAPNLETQVLTREGTPTAWTTKGKPCVWTDSDFEWWNIRLPKNPHAEPTWRDYKLAWPLDPYTIGIGSTGWGWRHRRSRYVAFDFDTIVGHSIGVGIPDAELARIRQAVQCIPWVQVRRSTGGKGIHLYVWFDHDGPRTKNHTQHARLARAVLNKISQTVGFDLSQHADTVGGNFWIWHQKMMG